MKAATRRGMDDPTDLAARYLALVERVRRYPMHEAARAWVLADLEQTYREELRAARAEVSPGAGATPTGEGSK
jgi:hypothetical protein